MQDIKISKTSYLVQLSLAYTVVQFPSIVIQTLLYPLNTEISYKA